jgi:hypothetical protein
LWLYYVDLIISGIAGTISKLIDSPVSIRPKHISSISLLKNDCFLVVTY